MAITLFCSLVSPSELANDEASWTGMRLGIGIAGSAACGIGYSGMDIDCGCPAVLADFLFGFGFLVMT
jgi:hypothetical protein